MPEGPEIALEADQLRRVLVDQPISAVRFAFPALARRAEELEAQRICAVRPRGKAMLIHFGGGLTIYSHNQLYGKWMVRRAGSMPKTGRQLRLAIETPTHWALLFSASEIALLDPDELAVHPYLAKLGPDALDPALEAADLALRFEDPRFARRRLAGLLLDQAFVAGLGNYLRSEICFEARVHPAMRPVDLSKKQRSALARATLVLSRRAYRTRGITYSPTQARALQRQGVSYARARHWVFARAGEPCRVCRTKVDRFDLAGRRVYTCPGCQPETRGETTRKSSAHAQRTPARNKRS